VKSFELIEPATVEEAVTLLDAEDPGVKAIAGGTALMLMMKATLFQPSRLVSLRRLDGAVRGIRVDPGGALRIGAMTTLTDLEYSDQVAAAAPVMTRTLRTLSNVRIRNVATLGGHLAHGDPHMDLPPVLLTLGARVRAVSRRGERWIAVGDLFLGYYQTAVARDELITEVEVPAQPAGVRAWYEKFTALSADDWPAVGVAVWCRLQKGSEADPIIAEARVAVSAAIERPLRLPGTEAALTHAPATKETFVRAADAAFDDVGATQTSPTLATHATPLLTDLRGTAAYKREMVRVHVRRALERAFRG
jgi:carbon-monoxide dehydrogenase medium subunit